jgi:hypothetical protein
MASALAALAGPGCSSSSGGGGGGQDAGKDVNSVVDATNDNSNPTADTGTDTGTTTDTGTDAPTCAASSAVAGVGTLLGLNQTQKDCVQANCCNDFATCLADPGCAAVATALATCISTTDAGIPSCTAKAEQATDSGASLATFGVAFGCVQTCEAPQTDGGTDAPTDGPITDGKADAKD